MNIIGARWWKFDFHTHSPASFDYGRGDDELKNITPKDWLKSFVDAGIECVAVTDHNSGGWIDLLKDAARDMRENEGVSIYIFPGVEITANGNIHILGIFDSDKTTQDIAAVVGASDFHGQIGNSDSVAEASAEVIAGKIIRMGGVAIPAHIDRPAGMLRIASFHTIDQIYKKSSAVEIVFPEGGRDGQHQDLLNKYARLGGGLPEVIGSDSHRPNEVGRAFTWVKMSAPTIEGLRLALVDGESSVRRSDKQRDDPNKKSELMIHGISISNAKYCGRGRPLKVSFNPWLNSVIGGRGSGKSSVLEFLRIGLGRADELLKISFDNELKENFARFYKKSESRDSEGVLLDQTSIEVILSKSEVFYRSTWSDGVLKFERQDGDQWVSEHGSVVERFPAKIFSQKQIFALAKNPSSLIDIIDESDEVDMYGWEYTWNELKAEYLSLLTKKRELEGRVAIKESLLGQLSDVELKIGIIEKSGHADVFKKVQSVNFRNNSSIETKSRIIELATKIEDIVNVSKDLEFDVDAFDGSLSFDKGERECVVRLGELTGDVLRILLDQSARLNGFIQDWDKSRQYSGYNEYVDSTKAEYDSLIESFKSSGVQGPEEYQVLSEKRISLMKRLGEIDSTFKELDILCEKIDIIYRKVLSHRYDLSVRRCAFIDKYFDGNESIKLRLVPLFNEDTIESLFRRVLERSDSAFAAEIYDVERKSGVLNKFINSVGDLGREGVDGSFDKIFAFREVFVREFAGFESGTVCGANLGKRFIDYLNGLRPNFLDQLMLWFPDDKLEVKFNDGQGMRGLAQGSAGQKAATVLTFLLSFGNEPLILDQPEDDLDNKLISHLIVKKIQESKSLRQMIVVTHNPNIVVNGDSELVVALQSSGAIEVLAAGGLQEQLVREEVCNIMEGGQIALKQRYQRMINS